MTVYIKYINRRNNLLWEQEDNLNLNNNNLLEIFNTDYIKNKLKELLSQKLPVLKKKSATQTFNLFLEIASQMSQNFIKNFSTRNLNFYEVVKIIFDYISQTFSKFIFNHPEFTNVVFVDVNKLVSVDNENMNNLNQEILDKIKNSKSKVAFEIEYSDLDKINQFCKLEDTKIFTLEIDNNYLCLPFEDEKKFKAINVANYYDSYFDITDQESSDILDILIEHKEKGTNEFIRKIGNLPAFKYKLFTLTRDQQLQLDGIQGAKSNEDIVIFIDEYDQEYIHAYSTFVHEFIHYKDDLLNKNKFTSNDVQDLLKVLKENFKKNEIISQNKIVNVLKLNKSATRYVLSVLEKKGYVSYTENFTKIKMNFLPEYGHSNIGDEEYFSSPIELNTHLSNVIIDFIHDKEKFNEYTYLLNLLTAQIEENDKFGVYKKSIEFLKMADISKKFQYNLIKFSNDEYKKMYEYYIRNDNHRTQEYKDGVRDLAALFSKFKILNTDPNFDIEFVYKKIPDWQQQILNNHFIKNLNFNEKQLNIFLTRFDTKNYNDIEETIFSFMYFDDFYGDAINLKFNQEELIKNTQEKIEEFIDEILNKKMKSIFNEIKKGNPEKFKDPKKLEQLKTIFEKNYKIKFKEKLNNYIKNKEVNKENVDKLQK